MKMALSFLLSRDYGAGGVSQVSQKSTSNKQTQTHTHTPSLGEGRGRVNIYRED